MRKDDIYLESLSDIDITHPLAMFLKLRPFLSANKMFYECVKKPEVSATEINFLVR